MRTYSIRRIGLVTDRNLSATRTALARINPAWGDTFTKAFKKGATIYYVCDWKMREKDWILVEKQTQGLVQWYNEGFVRERKQNTEKGVNAFAIRENLERYADSVHILDSVGPKKLKDFS